MSSFKRKRAGASANYPIVIRQPITKRRRMFVQPGVSYGRYSGRGMELKFHDVDFNSVSIPIAGVIQNSINFIAQGVSESQRIGRKCTIRAINWHWQLERGEIDDAAALSTPNSVRVIMYQDKQANGATAVVTDVLESADFQSFRNLSNSQRFVILYDKTITLNITNLASPSAADTSSSAVKRNGAFYKKCNIPLEFNAAAGNMAEIRSNNLGLLLISDDNDTDINSKIRLRFSDQ